MPKLTSKVDGYQGPISSGSLSLLSDDFSNTIVTIELRFTSGVLTVGGLKTLVAATPSVSSIVSVTGFDNLQLYISDGGNPGNVTPSVPHIFSGTSLTLGAATYTLLNPTPNTTYQIIYRNDVNPGYETISASSAASLDPTKWTHWGDSGSVVDGQLVFPIGRSGGVTSVDTFPAESQFTVDMTISDLTNTGSSEGNGHYWIGIVMTQYGSPRPIPLNIIFDWADGVVSNASINDNAQAFWARIPLELLEVSGTSIRIPKFSVISKNDGIHVYINGTLLQIYSNPGYAPTDGTVVLYNDYFNGVTVSYDNVSVTGPASAWETLKAANIPGIMVLKGVVTSAPIDSKGHGHPEDIIPVGTNFAVIVTQKYSAPEKIDGKKALDGLGTWEKIDDKLGGLMFYGALTDEAKKQYKALIDGYETMYH